MEPIFGIAIFGGNCTEVSRNSRWKTFFGLLQLDLVTLVAVTFAGSMVSSRARSAAAGRFVLALDGRAILTEERRAKGPSQAQQ